MENYTKEKLLSNALFSECSRKEMIKHLDTKNSHAVVFTTFQRFKKLKKQYYNTYSAWFFTNKSMEYSRGYTPVVVYIDEDILPLSKKQYDNMIMSCIPSLARSGGKFKIVKSSLMLMQTE